MSLAQSLLDAKDRIQKAETLANRAVGSVTMVAVTKQRSVDQVSQLIELGVKHFGENQVQEALKKITALPETDICWHFIGHLQRNKAKQVSRYFDWVHSVDTRQLAEKLNAHRHAFLPKLNICIQVNIDAAPTKHGVLVDEVEALALSINQMDRLQLRGLMAIPDPATPQLITQHYQKLYDLKEQLGRQGIILDTLSMGMSGDFEIAIACGATMVRLGTVLFGSRQQKEKA